MTKGILLACEGICVNGWICYLRLTFIVLYSNQSGLGIYHLLFLFTTALHPDKYRDAEAKASLTFCALY